jgi:hypothetical protein
MSKLLKIGGAILLGIVVVFCANYFRLGMYADQAVSADSRNSGIEISLHYANYVDPNDIVLDIRSVSATNSKMDVTRVLLQVAAKLSSRHFAQVYLASKGSAKFKLSGDYFQEIGEEYPYQNAIFTIRTMPENVLELDGTHAYGTWTGGILGVVMQQMKDFGDFEDRWFANDLKS